MKNTAFALLIASLGLTGCFVDDGPDTVAVARGNGLLTVTWTVEGTDDPAACAAEGADSFDLIVERASGGMAAHTSDACESFVTSVELNPGSYFADAILMDPGGHPITTAVDLGYFDIFGDDELVIDADFPPGSFY